jgi:hypothetical protein
VLGGGKRKESPFSRCRERCDKLVGTPCSLFCFVIGSRECGINLSFGDYNRVRSGVLGSGAAPNLVR